MTPLNKEASPSNPAERLLQVLGILLLTLVGYSLFVTLLGNYLSYTFWGANLNIGLDFEEGITQPNQIAALKFIQLMYQLGTYLMPPLVFALIYRRSIPSFYKLNRAVSGKQLLWVLAFLVTGIFGAEFLYHLFDGVASLDDIRALEAKNAVLTDQMLDDLSFGGIAYSFLIFAIMPALVEELYFRGMLQGTMVRLSGRPHNAIFISSLAFALMHPSTTGFLAYMVMGLVLGYLYHYTGNMKLNMLLHLLNNSFSLVMTFLYKGGVIELDPASDLPMYLGIIGIVGLGTTAYLFIDKGQRKHADALATKTATAFTKAFEHQNLNTAQLVLNELMAQGYDAILINKQDASNPFGYIEVHVPIDQLDTAQAHIEHKLNL